MHDCRSKTRTVFLPILFGIVPLAPGQIAVPARPTLAPAKPLAFEVVSIRPSRPDSSWSISWQTTPDAYSANGESIRSMILMAYFPEGLAFWSNDRISGAPKWIDDLYDVNAKVSKADVDAWQKQGLTLDRKTVLQEMLRSMLVDRCQMAAHRVPGGQLDGYALEAGKHGLRLTESKQGKELPLGVRLGDGGVMVPNHNGEEPHLRFYNVTMDEVARFFAQAASGHPILTTPA